MFNVYQRGQDSPPILTYASQARTEETAPLQLQTFPSSASGPLEDGPPEKEVLPTIRQTDKLPFLLKKGVELFNEDYERELFLLSTLTACSGLLTRVTGVYNKARAYPNLFLLVVAAPASGKSVMLYARDLIGEIHKEKVEASRKLKAEYLRKIKELGKNANHATVEKPPFNAVLIPADCSSSKFISHLADNQVNDCPAVMIESEIDSLAKAQKNDWSNFSDNLRKVFQNEPISLSRKTDDEYVEVTLPKLAVALSGTLNQLRKLINNSEDGLYSRFIVFTIESSSRWSDVSPCDACPNLTEKFEEQATEYLDFWKYISKGPLQALLSPKQWETINTHFGESLSEVSEYLNPDRAALVKRHGAMLHKMCMVLTALRYYEEKGTSGRMVCRQEDFNTALYLVDRSLERSLELFELLPGANNENLVSGNKIYDLLPNTFSYTQAMAIAEVLGMSERTIQRYLRKASQKGVFTRTEDKLYQKH